MKRFGLLCPLKDAVLLPTVCSVVSGGCVVCFIYQQMRRIVPATPQHRALPAFDAARTPQIHDNFQSGILAFIFLVLFCEMVLTYLSSASDGDHGMEVEEKDVSRVG